MAKFEVDMPDNFMQELLNVTDPDEIAVEILTKASSPLETSLKDNVSRATGIMANSIKATKPKKNSKGFFVAVRPTGKDGKGVRNAEKLAYNEYGTSKQKARPVIASSVSAVEGQVHNLMQETFDGMVKG